MDEGRKRLEHMRHDPRVTLDLLDESDWYTHVSMEQGVLRAVQGLSLRLVRELTKSRTTDLSRD